jgi:TPR repeat protein
MRIRRPGLTVLSFAITLAIGSTVYSRTTVDALLERAGTGDHQARVELAKIYTAQDQRELALQQLEEAAKAGNVTAHVLLAEQYAAATGTDAWTKAKEHATAAGEAGKHEVMTRIGIVASLRAIDAELPEALRKAYAADAASLLGAAHNAGNHEAQWHLGYLHVTGLLERADAEAGMAMIMNAADAGNVVAARWMSHVYDQIALTGKGRIGIQLPMTGIKEHALDRTVHYLKLAAVAGNRHAMTELAERYANGRVPGGKADPDRAARLLQTLVTAQPVGEQTILAGSTNGGLAPQRGTLELGQVAQGALDQALNDVARGAGVLRPVALHAVGNPERTLASASTQPVTTTHPAVGFEAVHDTAVIDDLRAQLRARDITLSQTRRELEHALSRVAELEKQLAEFGKFQALRSTADERNRKGLEFYALGDYESALPHFRAAAELDHAGAVANLAMLYLNGHAVPQDMKQAARLLQRAVELGNLVAAENLAELYETGAGLGYDPSRAIVWYRKALALGSAKASAALVRLGAGSAQ